jgi:biopolymer transport protein TolR
MSEINVTPLVDVMLVLLVIFIITAPLLVSAVKVDLPKTDAAKAMEAPKIVALSIDKAGQVFVDDRPVTPEELNLAMEKSAQANPDTEVQLRADAAVAYGQVVQVMGVAQKAGLNRIGFVADNTAPAAPGVAPR